MIKRAIILFNLGGPDNPSAIQPFLYNLFRDPSIINLPSILRVPLAKIISIRRAKVAKEIYAYLGGKSPLLDSTREQAEALKTSINNQYPNDKIKIFLCMRYWHPMSSETVAQVKAFDPEEIVLLPLYPQYSVTTTGSSFADWRKRALEIGLHKSTYSICCYATQKKWAEAQADLLKNELKMYPNVNEVRILFSAHGLPKKIVERGDPYQWQIEQSAQAIATIAKISDDRWKVCYQSRVGPLEWTKPSLDDELQKAAREKEAVIILPISFVSEHTETLVELDIEYKNIAKDLGLSGYRRVPAVGTHPTFIEGLRDLALTAFEQKTELGPLGNKRYCPSGYIQCPCR